MLTQEKEEEKKKKMVESYGIFTQKLLGWSKTSSVENRLSLLRILINADDC